MLYIPNVNYFIVREIMFIRKKKQALFYNSLIIRYLYFIKLSYKCFMKEIEFGGLYVYRNHEGLYEP